MALMLFILPTARVLAQGFTLVDTTDFQEQTVFNTDAPSGGFDFDSSGDIYYLGGENGGAYEESALLEATAGNYNNQSTIVNFAASPISGDFVVVHGATEYYGYFAGNDQGPIASVGSAGSTSYNVPFNYDLAFYSNTAFVSANVGETGNEVYTLATTGPEAGTYKEILNCGGDYSGPIAFTSSGQLIYGGSGFIPGGIPDIYIFSAADVQRAITSGTPMQLSDATTVISDTGNSDLAVSGNDLFESFSSVDGNTTVDLFNLNNPTAAPILIGTDLGYYIAAIRVFDGDLFLDETDGISVSNFIEIIPIPEPGAGWLAVAGLGLLYIFRPRRAQ